MYISVSGGGTGAAMTLIFRWRLAGFWPRSPYAGQAMPFWPPSLAGRFMRAAAGRHRADAPVTILKPLYLGEPA